jgi:hypothetical protein
LGEEVIGAESWVKTGRETVRAGSKFRRQLDECRKLSLIHRCKPDPDRSLQGPLRAWTEAGLFYSEAECI